MLKFISFNYTEISRENLEDFSYLRKKVFHDQLNWLVKCQDGMEFDEYDNEDTTYLLGFFKNKIVCGCRFIDMKHHNMITGTFYKYFNKINLIEGKYIEVTRILIDKERTVSFGIKNHPISLEFFINIKKFAKNLQFEGIYAVVSEYMLNILEKLAIKIKIQQQGISEKKQNIYLIIIPTE